MCFIENFIHQCCYFVPEKFTKRKRRILIKNAFKLLSLIQKFQKGRFFKHKYISTQIINLNYIRAQVMRLNYRASDEIK